ncbi:MAG: 16S rRNA (cytidine(1402)-2'-O)-methyltransferase [Anaerolineales bacterium]
MGKLYLVATPIGNLEDITLRALRILREVPLIAAEDTRHTRKLLARYEITTPTISYHEHNKQERERELMEALVSSDVALVSDAGTPALSDPGYELVQAAIRKGVEVVPIPGPAAPIAALIASGLPTDAFLFLGYIPRKAAERHALFADLLTERRTAILFEVPHRVQATLNEMQEVLGGDRLMAAARELTKVHEQILRGSIADVRAQLASGPAKGEFTLLIGPAPQEQVWSEARVRDHLEAAINEGLSRSAAARKVAQESGWSKNDVYRLGLEGT